MLCAVSSGCSRFWVALEHRSDWVPVPSVSWRPKRCESNRPNPNIRVDSINSSAVPDRTPVMSRRQPSFSLLLAAARERDGSVVQKRRGWGPQFRHWSQVDAHRSCCKPSCCPNNCTLIEQCEGYCAARSPNPPTLVLPATATATVTGNYVWRERNVGIPITYRRNNLKVCNVGGRDVFKPHGRPNTRRRRVL